MKRPVGTAALILATSLLPGSARAAAPSSGAMPETYRTLNYTAGARIYNVNPVGVPIARDDDAATAESTPVTIGVLANDDDAGFPPLIVESVTRLAHGTATVNADGTIWIDLGPFITTGGYNGMVTSTSNAGPSPLDNGLAWVGSSDGETGPGRLDPMRMVRVNVGAALAADQLGGALIRFRLGGTFQVLLGGIQGTGWGIDDIGITNSIVLSACNHPPVARDDATTESSTRVRIDVLANDTDRDSDTLAVSGAGQPAHGTATVNADGTVTCAPQSGYVGGERVAVTVTEPANRAPTANDDEASTSRVLANGFDPDGDALIVASFRSARTHSEEEAPCDMSASCSSAPFS